MRGRRRPERVDAVAVVVIAAVAVRLPLILATRPVGFDDGVYAASVQAMRRGAVPFRDVFSSQGPVFLPVLRAFDLVGGEAWWAPRLAMMAAAIAIGLAVLSIAGRFTTVAGATTLGVIAATSTSVVLAAGPLESDGIALAFATVALSVALHPGPGFGPGRAVVVGLLLGLGLATKSLFVVPPALAVIVLLGSRHSIRLVATTIGAALVAGFAVTVPFGFDLVWDQYVAFHTAVPRQIEPLHNLLHLGRRVIEYEVATLGVGLVAAVWAMQHRRHRSDDGSVRAAVLVWVAASAAVVVFATDVAPGFGRYLAFVIVPVLIAVAMVRPPVRMLIAVAVLVLPLQLALNGARLDGRELEPHELDLIAALDALADGSVVVGDAPSLTYAAGTPSPPWLVDTSFARIRAGYLTHRDVEQAIGDPDTCAVIMWSGRLSELDPELPGRAASLG